MSRAERLFEPLFFLNLKWTVFLSGKCEDDVSKSLNVDRGSAASFSNALWRDPRLKLIISKSCVPLKLGTAQGPNAL